MIVNLIIPRYVARKIFRDRGGSVSSLHTEPSDIRASKEARGILIVQGRAESENTPVNRLDESK